MLKTIKKKKEVRIDELIKYITMNAHTLLADKEFYTFKSNYGTDVTIDAKGNVNFSFMLYTPEDLFTIEIEEPITEDAEFKSLIVVLGNGNIHAYYGTTIKVIKELYVIPIKQIYALINGKLELILESED